MTKFKHRCRQVIRGLERTGRPVAITRRGKACLQPSGNTATPTALQPWERLRAHALPLAAHDRAIPRSRAVRLWKP